MNTQLSLVIKILVYCIIFILYLYCMNLASSYIFLLAMGYNPFTIINLDTYTCFNILFNLNNFSDKTFLWIKPLWLKSSLTAWIFTTIIFLGIYFWIKSTLLNPLKNNKNLHGNASFAAANEIKQSGLIIPKQKNSYKAKPSIILGMFNNKFLEFSQPKFVSIAAPTRSGKGVGIVIPNLLHWNSSVVCLDIKGENFDKTAGFREKFTKVYRFDPFAQNLCSHRYNPLSYINKDPIKTISDIQTMARILWPRMESDPIWNDSSCTLFQGLVLFLIDKTNILGTDILTMHEVYKTAGELGVLDLNNWNNYINILTTMGFDISPRTMQSLNAYFSLPTETRTSVLGTFNASMQLFNNPSVAASTCADDFDLANIRKQKLSIYVCITPNRLAQAAPLLNIFFSQLIQINTQELPEQNSELKQTALILLDEFTALGKIDIIETAISYIAGYNLRLLLIYQSQAQLAATYDEHKAKNIITNCGCQILFAPREQDDAEEYSKILGDTTVETKNISFQQGMLFDTKVGEGKNISIQQNPRALMLPQELRQMGQKTCIIIIEDTKPIKCDKIRYYEDEYWTRRILPSPLIPKLVINDEWLGISSNNNDVNNDKI